MEIYKRTDRRSRIKPIVTHLRPKARIKERVFNSGRIGYDYEVKVQIKVLPGVWVTVWAETCDYSDGDTRPYIKICAEEVYEALTAKV